LKEPDRAGGRAIGMLVRRLALPITMVLFAVALTGDRMAGSPRGARIDLPPLVLWAWDRDDDLRFVDTRDTAVAFLASTITLRRDDVFVEPRHNSLKVPEGIRLVAVAHVESDRSEAPVLDAVQLDRFIEVLAALAAGTPHEVLQIDFEALSSQRGFLVAALDGLRQRLPDTAISVTALSSWCDERWTGRLAADEVVPMFFRLGPDGRRIRERFAHGGDFPSASCRASLGVATDELPSVLPAGRRIYAFSPRRWTAEMYYTVRGRIPQWSYASLSE
jgi:hypothetical protein